MTVDWRQVLDGRCPWCEFAGMVSRHAPVAHPDLWDYFVAHHRAIQLPRRGRTYVPTGADAEAVTIRVDGEVIRL